MKLRVATAITLSTFIFYLPFSSSHPEHCKKAIPYGVALRIRRNCSTEDSFVKRCEEYKGYLKLQNYNVKLVDKQFEKAKHLEREQLLKPKTKTKNIKFPLVVDYNPRLPDISAIIKKHSHLLESNQEIKEIFPLKSVIPAYRRTKNLKDILAPSKFKRNLNREQVQNYGCFKCNRKCDLCNNFLLEAKQFTSFVTGYTYNIKQNIGCNSNGVIYLASCNKCKLQYVGSTSNAFKVRFRNHKSDMLRSKKSCELAIHFNSFPHALSDFSFIVIEQIQNTTGDLDGYTILKASFFFQEHIIIIAILLQLQTPCQQY